VFSWDARKARLNLEKHSVSFEEAATVFADPEALEWEDSSHSKDEERMKRLGCSASGRVLILIYTWRRIRNDEETIRIISARRASAKERKAYFG
jgi:uncharacterized DUF497 family protein